MNKYTPDTGTLETVSPDTSNTKIWLGTAVSLVVAALILVTLILPAEFNRDPLGVGQMLGLMGLSESSLRAIETVRREDAGFHEDTVSFQLLPFEFVEYKYQMNQDSAILYSWTTTNTVSFDFHGEPADGPEGYAESFSIGNAKQESGAFTAPFTGIHGWFWENRGTDTVTVTLRTAGFYSETLEFRDGDIKKKVLADAP